MVAVDELMSYFQTVIIPMGAYYAVEVFRNVNTGTSILLRYDGRANMAKYSL